MHRTGCEMSQVLFRTVAFVKNQGQLLGHSLETLHPAADPLVPGRRGLTDVGLIAPIALMIKRQPGLLIGKQGQGELAQIAAFLFVVSSLGQLTTVVEGVDEREVVGGVVKQGFLTQGKELAEFSQQVLLNGLDVSRLDLIHMIPEALAGQFAGGSRTQTRNDTVLVPVTVQGAFTACLDGAIHSGQREVVSDGELGSSFWIDGGNVTIDDLDELELLGPVPEPSGSAEFFDPQLLQRSWTGSLATGEVIFQFLQEALFGTEVDLFDDTGFAVDPSGADPVGVGVTSAFFEDETGHNR
jgi:hypothetical protein